LEIRQGKPREKGASCRRRKKKERTGWPKKNHQKQGTPTNIRERGDQEVSQGKKSQGLRERQGGDIKRKKVAVPNGETALGKNRKKIHQGGELSNIGGVKTKKERGKQGGGKRVKMVNQYRGGRG